MLDLRFFWAGLTTGTNIPSQRRKTKVTHGTGTHLFILLEIRILSDLTSEATKMFKT